MSMFRLIPLRWLLTSAAGVMGVSCSLMIGYDDRQQVALRPHDAGPDGAITDTGAPSTDASVPADSVPEAGADGDAEPPDEENRLMDVGPVEATPVLQLAFIEDPAEDVGRLRLVDVRASLIPNQPTVEAPAWRRTLNAREQSGDALDFAWSPDGRHIALRYLSLDGTRLAFFAMPGGVELPVDELTESSVQPEPTPNYAWSPDSGALAVEFASAGGPSVGAYLVGAERVAPVAPMAFAAPPATMAWASSTRLFVERQNVGGREIVIIDRSTGTLTQEPLDTAPFVSALELRPAPGGILGAGNALSSLYFWTPDGSETEHKASSYVSSQQWFVADAELQSPSLSLYALGNIAEPVANLPDCPVVLTWMDGPTSGSLARSKLVCLSVANDAANITVQAFDDNVVAGVTALGDESLQIDLSAEPNWSTHARTFSPDAGWLVIATAGGEYFIDLRADAPAYFGLVASSTGTTATTFSPSGGHLLLQRGQEVRWWQLGVSENGEPTFRRELRALEQPAACETAQNSGRWCGAPTAGASTSARWAPKDDVAVLLTASEGLVELAPSDDGFGSVVTSVSTCGAGCVTAYAFSP